MDGLARSCRPSMLKIESRFSRARRRQCSRRNPSAADSVGLVGAGEAKEDCGKPKTLHMLQEKVHGEHVLPQQGAGSSMTEKKGFLLISLSTGAAMTEQRLPLMMNCPEWCVKPGRRA